MRKQSLIKVICAILVFAFIGTSGCVYYNTFHNARKSFNNAEKERKKRVAQGGTNFGTAGYKTAIEKSLKVVENYPNSSWYDDALYVLGVSYYYTNQFGRSERRLRELLLNYPESKYRLESKIHLSKALLMQEEMEEAMALFQELLYGDLDRSYKAEAANALADYYYDQEIYDSAQIYYLAVRDSLGNDIDKKRAQSRIAESYYKSFRFNDALVNYLQILDMDPDKKEYYHALYTAATCCYRLQKLSEGQAHINTLLEDERYYDSTSALNLLLAGGYELDGDIDLAQGLYEEVSTDETKRKHAGEAYYRLGLIFQFDYDDLAQAKENYDHATRLAGSTDGGRDALQRSSDIGKLEQYQRTLVVDSTVTSADIEAAARVQYQLAELYWFRLNKPDTAMLEMHYLVDSLPETFETPKGLIALSQMYLEHSEDTVIAESLLNLVITNFVDSDYMVDALDALGLRGTAADTGYAKVYLHRAENFMIDDNNIDSARYYYQYIVDQYPDSKYYLQARFGLIWLTEQYDPPGDSSLVFAYQEFADSFPGSYWADEAFDRISDVIEQPVEEPEIDSTVVGEQDTIFAADTPSEDEDPFGDEPIAGGIYAGLYISPAGDSIADLWKYVTVTDEQEEFIFPEEAYRMEFQGNLELYFQIKLDSYGEVVDLVLKRPSGVEAIDNAATLTVGSMTFDIIRLRSEEQEAWWVYKYIITKPDFLER